MQARRPPIRSVHASFPSINATAVIGVTVMSIGVLLPWAHQLRAATSPATGTDPNCSSFPDIGAGEDDEQAVREWVKNLGFRAEARGDPITYLFLEGSHVRNYDLKRIGRLRHLQMLYLGQTKIGDAGLEELAGLRSVIP